MLNPLTDINGIRVLSRLGRPTRSYYTTKDGKRHKTRPQYKFQSRGGRGRQKLRHIPAALVPQVRRLIENGRRLEKLEAEYKALMTEESIERLKKAARFVQGGALDYLDKRRGNMRYGWLRRNGYCISSSHVEAAARILVARRCKQAGMHWRHHNAACVCAIIARLRSAA